MTSRRPLLTVDDLAVSFSNGPGPCVRAVDGVQMTIYPRQTLAVVGESGCRRPSRLKTSSTRSGSFGTWWTRAWQPSRTRRSVAASGSG